ncbi:MAG: hypothetical protein E7478_00905 [Ruminococcaceae bacterium]|nr:hypothetical protein [Oscillospiraceae bacterium]
MSEQILTSAEKVTAGQIHEILGGEAQFDIEQMRDRAIGGVTYHDTSIKDSVYFNFSYNSVYTNGNPCFDNMSALKKNALFVVTRKPIDGCRCYIVPDVKAAYQQFAAQWRGLFDAKVVGVTGSVGKTTTTGIIANVLAQQYVTEKTKESKNIPTAVADCVLRFDSRLEYFALEMASSQPEQIHKSSMMGRPDIAVITTIGTAHIDLMKTRQNICDTKLQILDGSAKTAPYVLNFDDEYLSKVQTEHPIISYAIDSAADYRAEDIVMTNDRLEFDIVYDGGRCHIVSDMHGRHNVYNALAAFAVGKWAGMQDELIAQGIAEYHADGIRQNVLDFDGVTVIADYFSIDTASMISAFQALDSRECSGRKIAVLGHIMRMGEESRRMHHFVGEHVVKNNIDVCLCFDDDSVWIAEKVNELGGNAIFFNNNRYELIRWLRENVQKGDTVLFKGAQKYSHFEDIIETVFAYKDEPTVQAVSAAAMCLDSGRMVYAKNAKRKLPPISLTMIMTLVLAAENTTPERMITVPDRCLRYSGSGYANVLLKAGEVISVEDLMYAVAVRSAYDAACVLADHIGGSEKAFVDMMNKKAQVLGMNDTHFTNCCGAHEDAHYSTAADLLRLCAYAYNNKLLDRMLRCTKYTCRTCDRQFATRNRMMLSGSPYYYPYAAGMKITNSAKGRHCAAMCAEKDGRSALCIVLKSPDEPRAKTYDQNTPDKRYSLSDSMKLLEYVFNN